MRRVLPCAGFGFRLGVSAGGVAGPMLVVVAPTTAVAIVASPVGIVVAGP